MSTPDPDNDIRDTLERFFADYGRDNGWVAPTDEILAAHVVAIGCIEKKRPDGGVDYSVGFIPVTPVSPDMLAMINREAGARIARVLSCGRNGAGRAPVRFLPGQSVAREHE